MPPVVFQESEETSSATLVVIGDPVVLRHESHWSNFEVISAGAALTGFQMEQQAYSGGSWATLVADGTWTTSTSIKRYTSADLSLLADAATGHAWVDVNGAYAVRFKAKTAGTTTVTIQGATTSRNT